MIEENGILIIRLKFFRFLNNNNNSLSEKQIEILRTFSFINVEDELELLDIDEKKKLVNSPLKLFTIFIESMNEKDLIRFTGLNSCLTSLLTEIFSTKNLFSIIFGFINENSKTESKIILDILNKCKKLNNLEFYNYLQEFDLSSNEFKNTPLKSDYQIIEVIYKELLFYIEKSFKKLNSFFAEIRDYKQKEKFTFLKNWLEKNNFPFEKNKEIENVFSNTFNYFKSRSRWKCLIRAKIEILKINENLKATISSNDLSLKNRLNEKNSNCKEQSSFISKGSYFFPLNKQLSCIINKSKLPKEELNNFSYNFDNDFNFEENNIKTNKEKSFSSQQFIPKKGEMMTQRKSIESSFTQYVFKNFNKNLQNIFVSMYSRFTEEKGCISCESTTNSDNHLKSFNCTQLASEYMSLKNFQKKIEMENISEIGLKKEDESINIHFSPEDYEESIKNALKKKNQNDNNKSNIKNSINDKNCKSDKNNSNDKNSKNNIIDNKENLNQRIINLNNKINKMKFISYEKEKKVGMFDNITKNMISNSFT